MPSPEAVGILSGRLGMSPLEMSSFSRKPMEFGAPDFETPCCPSMPLFECGMFSLAVRGGEHANTHTHTHVKVETHINAQVLVGPAWQHEDMYISSYSSPC